MPIHDWTKVEAGLFHGFHQQWVGTIAAALNTGVLPEDSMALAERWNENRVPDVLTLKWDMSPQSEKSGGVAPLTSHP